MSQQLISKPQQAGATINYINGWNCPEIDIKEHPEILMAIIATCEYAQANMFKNLRRNVTVNVKFKAIDKDPETGESPVGVCHSPIQMVEIKRPIHVEVEVSPFQSISDIVDTIFHELTHAEQLFEGRLARVFIKQGKKPLAMWQGRAYSQEFVDYVDYPWEIEARENAARLHKELHELNSSEVPNDRLAASFVPA